MGRGQRAFRAARRDYEGTEAQYFAISSGVFGQREKVVLVRAGNEAAEGGRPDQKPECPKASMDSILLVKRNQCPGFTMRVTPSSLPLKTLVIGWGKKWKRSNWGQGEEGVS